MNAQKQMTELKKQNLEVLIGGGTIERTKKAGWLKTFFARLFCGEPDLTLEKWREIEFKRGSFERESMNRDRHQPNHYNSFFGHF